MRTAILSEIRGITIRQPPDEAPLPTLRHAGILSAEDQAVVDEYRAMLAACKDPQPWTPGSSVDVAVRIGPFVERAHPRLGDDRGPVIAVALVHPDTPHTPYSRRFNTGWVRCETTAILGTWQPAYRMLTHAAAALDLPDDIGMRPAHYAVHVEARRPDGTRYALLRLGPYTQCGHTDRDVDQLNAQLAQAAPGTQVLTASAVPFDFSGLESYSDPYESDAAARLAAAVAGRDLPHGIDLSA
ncbi:hypothetical protein OG239_43095 (plasmid) [Streptomyces sp. NBC_00868]|uniref:hypothetical protein n=1 Tax=Streptomyces sp. NBC_00868 TaxID=2903683 RepID=UPI002F90E680|nr:hypothetical protein OG239_43095 [Streptomyces sp. NBC_00868]